VGLGTGGDGGSNKRVYRKNTEAIRLERKKRGMHFSGVWLQAGTELRLDQELRVRNTTARSGGPCEAREFGIKVRAADRRGECPGAKLKS